MRPPAEKPKNRPNRAVITGLGCSLIVGMLIVGGIVGLAAGLIITPNLVGFQSTQFALNTRAAELEETSVAQAGVSLGLLNTADANRSVATSNALNNQATRAALFNDGMLLNQTATQSMQNVLATRTADAVSNVRQMTQIALDYSATQAALQQNATQVELNYQQTQAAIQGAATAIQSNAQAQVALATATPTPTTPVRATNTLPATLAGFATQADGPSLSASFARSQVPDEWILSDQDDWVLRGDTGLQAGRANSWLVYNGTFEGDIRLEVRLEPAIIDRSEYYVLFNVNSGGESYALGWQARGLEVETITLYRWQVDDPARGQLGLATRSIVQSQAVRGVLVGDTTLTLVLRDDRLRADLNRATVFEAELASNGRGSVGVQFPTGATLRSIEVSAP